jgi:tetratricopeptide (TPR) repeat protein
MENYQEALNYLNQAIASNPRNYHAKINLALVYKQLGSLDKSITILQEVIKDNPKDAAAYTNLGNVYQLQAKYEDAAILYLQALELDFNDDDTLCNLGLALSRLNYHDYAKIAFEEGININPGNKLIV